MKRLAKQAYADRVLGGKKLVEQIKVSEWTTWLQSQPWFVAGKDNVAENFPLVVEHLLRPEAYRRSVLLDLVALKHELGPGYRAVAELVLRGLAGTILTTNFDICLPKALTTSGHTSGTSLRSIALRAILTSTRRLPARRSSGFMGKLNNTPTEILSAKHSRWIRCSLQKLSPLLDATPLVVVGYRGAEASICVTSRRRDGP